MTIKIQAFQKCGVAQKELEDEFEFCCWVALHGWLDSKYELHSCNKEHKIKV